MEGVRVERRGAQRRRPGGGGNDDDADEDEAGQEDSDEVEEYNPYVRQALSDQTLQSVALSTQNRPSRLIGAMRANIRKRKTNGADDSRSRDTGAGASATTASAAVADRLAAANRRFQSIFDGLEDDVDSGHEQQLRRVQLAAARLQDREAEIEREPDLPSALEPPAKRRKTTEYSHAHHGQRVDAATAAASRNGDGGGDDDDDDDEPFVEKHTFETCYLCMATTIKYPAECTPHLQAMAVTIPASLRNNVSVNDIADVLFAYQETEMRAEFRKYMPPHVFAWLVPRLSAAALAQHIVAMTNASGQAEMWIALTLPRLKELYSVMQSRATYVRRRLNDAHVAGTVAPADVDIDRYEVANLLKIGNFILTLEKDLASDKYQLLREQSGLLDTLPRGSIDNAAIARQLYAFNVESPIKPLAQKPASQRRK